MNVRNKVRASRVIGFALFLSSTLTVVSASAAIVSTSGNAQSLVIPTDLREGQFEGEIIFGFDELSKVEIPANTIAIDYIIADSEIGMQFDGVIDPPVSPAYLPAGVYDSHILHYDTIGVANLTKTIADGTFTFDSDIVAFIVNTTFLLASDPFFGVSTTTYEDDVTRRFDSAGQEGGVADQFTLVSRRSIHVDFLEVGTSHIDELRVLTNAVPEPSSLFLAGIGFFGTGLFYRRRSRD